MIRRMAVWAALAGAWLVWGQANIAVRPKPAAAKEDSHHQA